MTERRGHIGEITEERDFKVLCDGLLRFEFGPLIQTYASAGADRGIDADFVGEHGGVRGRWVFQYKFRSPSEALSRRRAWLKSMYVPANGEPGEFERPGVEGADAYVLMTNIPLTVPLVHAVNAAWKKKGRKRRTKPFVAWDPSTLNALLKGREHLARSWTGLREERCRQQIIAPIWTWLQRAAQRLSPRDSAPLWPLVLTTRQEPLTRPTFTTSTAWKPRFVCEIDAADLRAPVNDPDFDFARQVVFPRSLSSIGALSVALEDLVAALRGEVAAMNQTLATRIPAVHRIESAWDDVTTALAFALLELRWGYPMGGGHALRGETLGIGCIDVVRNVSAPPSIGPELDALVAEVPHGTVPETVRGPLRRFEEAVERAGRLLWSVVQFGTDADAIETSAAPPIKKPEASQAKAQRKSRRPTGPRASGRGTRT